MVKKLFDERTAVPEYGLKVKLDHVYPEVRSQNYTPSLRVIWSILPLILRYIWYFIKAKFTRKSVVMDYLKTVQAKPIYGVPLGGIGCGSIGRGFRGEFCRFQLKPGQYEYETVEANQFIVTVKNGHEETIFHSLLSAFPMKSLKSWKSEIDPRRCLYTGLYPRAWTKFDLTKYGIVLECRQVSPVFPGDYINTSLPGAAFIWNITNVGSEERIVTIAFTFKNGTGNRKEDKKSLCSSKEFQSEIQEGVILYHNIGNMPCTYYLGTESLSHRNISKCLYFDPNSNGEVPWIQLKNYGHFMKTQNVGQIYGEMAVGLAVQSTILPDDSEEVPFTLFWNMPEVEFPGRNKKYKRYYKEAFPKFSELDLVDRCMHYYYWDTEIFSWQNPVLSDSDLPEWYKGALFNETYFVSDGGSLWVSLDEGEKKSLTQHDARQTYGRFIYLEGHEYRMFNSYDVHFYASHCLAVNWPCLQWALAYDLKDAIALEIPQKVKMLYDGHVVERKLPNTVPHDAGDPGEEPWILVNSYPIHDVSQWRDLSPKFVLQVFRDFLLHPKEQGLVFVRDFYNTCYAIMDKCMENDEDHDGLIENSGKPDQTFDTWVMTGASAYCGGLWLAALYAMGKMAETVGNLEDRTKFEDLLVRAKDAFETKLWNGLYYNFDCSQDQFKSIMADQLCAQWYLRCCGVNDYPIIPQDHVRTTLKTIYQNNVLGFARGNLGAVNGFINGDKDCFTIQSEEVWTGVTYALAASFIQEGMTGEAFKTAGGMYKSMSELFGLAFSTPEALYEKKYYRAVGYMRPLSIWSMQLAWNEHKAHKK